MKGKIISTMTAILLAGLLSGCVGHSRTAITAVSREDGSGTRGAFAELFGIMEKGENGENIDRTTVRAEITNSTAVMLMTVSGNPNAIGYLSMGVAPKGVKTVEIDGVEATFANIKNGTYPIARPFHIATKAEKSEAAADFIRFILSEEGQSIVEDCGYISRGNTGSYAPAGAAGNVVVAGSSSVAPVMEKLREAYALRAPDVTIELQQSDSTTGMQAVQEGICEIGMASRELKESEKAAGLIPTVIAMDGIAVIVNQENPVDGLSGEEVRAIFTGEITDWAELMHTPKEQEERR